MKKSTKNKNTNTNKSNIKIIINNQNKKRGKGKTRSKPKETKHNIINVSPNIIMPQSQPQQTDYQGYARNYNNRQNQNPLLAQAEPEQQIFYNRNENPFMRDDLSTLTEDNNGYYYGNDLLSSVESIPPYLNNIYRDDRQLSYVNPMHQRKNILKDDNENDLLSSIQSENEQSLKNDLHQQALKPEEDEETFISLGKLFDKKDEGLVPSQVSPVKQQIKQIEERLKTENLTKKEKNYLKTQKANEAIREKFAKMREDNPDKYAKKKREIELTREIQQLKPEIERLNKIHINDLTAQQIQQLREMRPIYARLQAEKRHGTIENAIKNINTLEDDIKNNNVDNSGDDYISTQDKKLLNNLRLINGYSAYSAKRVTFNEAMEEIKQLRKALRLLQSSSSSERKRPFGANISTIRGMKKDDEEVLNVRDRSTKK